MTSSHKSLPRQSKPKPLGLAAGRGELPRMLIQAAKDQRRPIYIVAFEGQTEPELVASVPHIWVRFGQVRKTVQFLQENDVEEIVMAGHMTRPSLTELKPDWEAAKWIAHVGTKILGDDSLLSSIIEFIENKGFKVIGADDVLSSLLAPEGILTSCQPDEQALKDIKRGKDVLTHLSLADIGQAVVIQQGLVLGVEAIEGTDALIARCKDLQRAGPAGILIKKSKYQQDRRADLPTVGPQTVSNLIDAGLRGLAIETGHTLMLNSDEMVRLANRAGVFIIGIKGSRWEKENR